MVWFKKLFVEYPGLFLFCLDVDLLLLEHSFWYLFDSINPPLLTGEKSNLAGLLFIMIVSFIGCGFLGMLPANLLLYYSGIF
jgi:hypothetical protein